MDRELAKSREKAQPRAKWRGICNWALVAVWTLFIYTTIPIARGIQTWVTENWTRAAFSWFVYACIAIAFAAAIFHFKRRAEPLSRRQWVLLCSLSAVFAWGTWLLRENAEEALHFVQYGVLSLFLYRAYAYRYGDRGVFACAALLGAILGTLDEIIQWVVPRRFFDFRDIFINAISGVVIQAGLAAGLAPQLMAIPTGLRSARAIWRLLQVLSAMFLLIVSNTPDVWSPLYSYRPDFFVFNEAMVEYGYRHIDPQIGSFNSRLRLEKIEAYDRARAEEAADLLRKYPRDIDYQAFIDRYSMFTDPFLYEFRVRLFRRDRYWEMYRDPQLDPVRKKDAATIAWGENRILEKYYGNTLAATRRLWPTSRRAEAERAARTGPYHSPVSRELITWCSKRQLQAAIGGILVLTFVGEAIDVRRRRRKSSALRGALS